MAGIWIDWLGDAARSTGYPVIEVAGWKTRGHKGFRVVEGVVGHHTGTAQTAKGDYPSLNIVTKGRSDLPGPLCNYGLGRGGTIYVIAAGIGYHAGASRHAGFTDLNDEFVGIEAEHAGGILPWPGAQLDAYAKLVGAILRYIRRDTSRYVSHRGCALPAGRKPDPKNITDEWMRSAAAGKATTVPSAPAKPTGAAALPTLRKGMRNASVLALQRYMTKTFTSYNQYAPTGYFGDDTEAGLREFQRRVDLADDGIAGTATNKKLWFYGYRG